MVVLMSWLKRCRWSKILKNRCGMWCSHSKRSTNLPKQRISMRVSNKIKCLFSCENCSRADFLFSLGWAARLWWNKYCCLGTEKSHSSHLFLFCFFFPAREEIEEGQIIIGATASRPTRKQRKKTRWWKELCDFKKFSRVLHLWNANCQVCSVLNSFFPGRW